MILHDAADHSLVNSKIIPNFFKAEATSHVGYNDTIISGAGDIYIFRQITWNTTHTIASLAQPDSFE